jgi:hypothetical protein
MRLARFTALLAVFGIALFASNGRAAETVVFPTTYFCMCYCAESGTIVCVEDTSPDCNVCATACDGVGSIES